MSLHHHSRSIVPGNLLIFEYRARANGLLNVENPVAQAVREGRLEELPDSDDSE